MKNLIATRNRFLAQTEVLVDRIIVLENRYRTEEERIELKSLEAALAKISKPYYEAQRQIENITYNRKFEDGTYTLLPDGSISVNLKLDGKYEQWMN